MNCRQSWTELPIRNRRLAVAVLILAPLLFEFTAYLRDGYLQRGALFFEQKESGCLPWLLYAGTYRIDGIANGDLIAFHPKSIPIFKDGDVLVKLVAGREGDVVDVRDGIVAINGQVVGDVRRGAQRLGKPMQHWDTHYIIGPNEYFMLGSEYRSFDSRYWGVIKREQVIAKLTTVL